MTDFESIIDGPVLPWPNTKEPEIGGSFTREEFFDFLKAAFEWEVERENEIENDDEDTMT